MTELPAELLRSIDRFAAALPLLVKRPELQLKMIVSGHELRLLAARTIRATLAQPAWEKTLRVDLEALATGVRNLNHVIDALEYAVLRERRPEKPFDDLAFAESLYALDPSALREGLVADPFLAGEKIGSALPFAAFARFSPGVREALLVAKRLIAYALTNYTLPAFSRAFLIALGLVLQGVDQTFELDGGGLSPSSAGGCQHTTTLLGLTVSGHESEFQLRVDFYVQNKVIPRHFVVRAPVGAGPAVFVQDTQLLDQRVDGECEQEQITTVRMEATVAQFGTIVSEDGPTEVFNNQVSCPRGRELKDVTATANFSEGRQVVVTAKVLVAQLCVGTGTSGAFF